MALLRTFDVVVRVAVRDEEPDDIFNEPAVYAAAIAEAQRVLAAGDVEDVREDLDVCEEVI